MILPVPQSPMFSMTTADTYTPISSVHNTYEIPAVYLPKISRLPQLESSQLVELVSA